MLSFLRRFLNETTTRASDIEEKSGGSATYARSPPLDAPKPERPRGAPKPGVPKPEAPGVCLAPFDFWPFMVAGL